MEWAPCGVFEDGGEELVQKTENTGTSTIRERDTVEKWQGGGEELLDSRPED